MRAKKTSIEYKWVILIACFMMEFVCLGFCSSNPGLYTGAVIEALDIKRSVYSLTTSIRYITQVVTALFFGTLIQRFGAKKMVCVGLTSLVGSIFVRGIAANIFHFYMGSVLWGIGIVFSGGTMAGTIVKRWFHKDIGKYTGFVMSANGIGGAIAAQIVSPIINNGETFGYRKAYLLSGVISLAISILIVLCLREWPEGKVQSGDQTKKQPRGVVWSGLEYGEVLKRPYFYVTAVIVFLTGIGLQSVGSISIMNMREVGLSESFIAATVTLASLTLTFSKVLVGAAYDKKGLGFALMMCQLAAVISFVLNASLSNSLQGKVFAVIAVTLEHIALPVETVMVPLLTNELFGAKAYAKVLGILMAMNSLGLCLGAPIGEFYYDHFGTYTPCFRFFSALMVAIIITFQIVIRIVAKEKEKMIAKAGGGE